MMVGKRDSVTPPNRINLELRAPDICLLCGSPAVFYDLEGNVIKREPVSPVYTYGTLFESLCTCLAVQNERKIRNSWDFCKEPFPFCKQCEAMMGLLVDLYKKVEQLENVVKTKGIKGTSKFIPIINFDERSQAFRKVISCFDKSQFAPEFAEDKELVSNLTSFGVEEIKLSPANTHGTENNNNDLELADSFDAVDQMEDDLESGEVASDSSKDLDLEWSEEDEKEKWVPPKRKRGTQPKNKSFSATFSCSNVLSEDSKRLQRRCDVCKLTFSFGLITDHIKSHKVPIYNCPQCPYVFGNFYHYITRHTRRHPGIKLTCQMCPTGPAQGELVYDKKTALLRHLVEVHNMTEILIKCDEPSCSKTFFGVSEKNDHMAFHLGQAVCSTCGKFCRGGQALRQHMKIHEPEGQIECDSCPKKFKLTKALKNHQRKEHGLEMLKCEHCPKEYSSRTGYLLHLKSIHQIGQGTKFKCHICGKEFSLKGSLNGHLLTHDETKRFSCKNCDFAAKTRKSLQIHQLTHVKTRDYLCKLCSKGFRSQQCLNRHMKYHSEERSYVCDLCGKSYATSQDLRKHNKRVHKEEKNNEKTLIPKVKKKRVKKKK